MTPSHVNYVVVSQTNASLSSAEGLLREAKEQIETNFVVFTRDSFGRQCYNEDDHVIMCKCVTFKLE